MRQRLRIATHRTRWPLMLCSATLVGMVVGLWPALVWGSTHLPPLAIGELSAALRWPAVAAALLITTITLGADRDTGIEDELALAGVNPWPVRGADALASIIITAGASGWALGTAMLVRWGSWMVNPQPVFWSHAVLVPLLLSLASMLVANLVAVLLVHACARSALRTLGMLVGLILSFGLLLSVKAVLPGALTVVHPLSGPWRLIYTGESLQLILPFGRGLAMALTALWLVALGAAAAVGLRSRH